MNLEFVTFLLANKISKSKVKSLFGIKERLQNITIEDKVFIALILSQGPRAESRVFGKAKF